MLHFSTKNEPISNDILIEITFNSAPKFEQPNLLINLLETVTLISIVTDILSS